MQLFRIGAAQNRIIRSSFRPGLSYEADSMLFGIVNKQNEQVTGLAKTQDKQAFQSDTAQPGQIFFSFLFFNKAAWC